MDPFSSIYVENTLVVLEKIGYFPLWWERHMVHCSWLLSIDSMESLNLLTICLPIIWGFWIPSKLCLTSQVSSPKLTLTSQEEEWSLLVVVTLVQCHHGSEQDTHKLQWLHGLLQLSCIPLKISGNSMNKSTHLLPEVESGVQPLSKSLVTLLDILWSKVENQETKWCRKWALIQVWITGTLPSFSLISSLHSSNMETGPAFVM